MKLHARTENHVHRAPDPSEEYKQDVVVEGLVEAPPLPNAETFSQRVQDWYNVWRNAPQTKSFTITDWQRLWMMAPLVEAYLENPRPSAMAEIRQNETLLGATHHDRMRMRITVKRADGSTARPGVPQPGDKQPGIPDLVTARRKRMADAS